MTKDKEQSAREFREFWISKELSYVELGPGAPSPLMKSADGGRFTHVIEIAAVEPLKQQLAEKDREIAELKDEIQRIIKLDNSVMKLKNEDNQKLLIKKGE